MDIEYLIYQTNSFNPDGSGDTYKNKTLDEVRDALKTSPSTVRPGVRAHGQKLPMTLFQASLERRHGAKSSQWKAIE